MSQGPIKLPWSGSWVPHGTLDVGRACNIHCRACYNGPTTAMKPLAQLEEELVTMLQHRRLHTVTIAGGEPTLHPELAHIVRLIKGRGLRAAMVTNGLLVTEDLLKRLSGEGIDMILVHVDRGQERPDLPRSPSLSDVQMLRDGLGRKVAAHGITTGIATTLYASHMNDLPAVVEEIFCSPVLDVLLATGCCDFSAFGELEGTVRTGIRQRAPGQPSKHLTGESVGVGPVEELLADTLKIEPLVFVPSSHDPEERRWISYTVGAVTDGGGLRSRFSLKPSPVERMLFLLMPLLYGRYIFYHRETVTGLRIRILLNALAAGGLASALDFIRASRASGSELRPKHLVFQESPRVEADGTVSMCLDCPDATVRGGTLVPGCLADRVLVRKGGDHEEVALGG